MNTRLIVGLSLGVTLTAGLSALAWSPTQDEFDHLRHQRVSPSCAGCHRVEATGVTMPQPSLCAGCHDGQLVRRIDWSGPKPSASNLAFDHVQVLEAKEAALGMTMPCATCHTPQGAERMDVRRAVVSGCLGCHSPGADHYVDAACDKCHVPLAEATELSLAQVSELPVPEDHLAEGFAMGHGQLAEGGVERCSVCHARDLCSSCHVNAPEVAAIQALPSDARVAQLAAARELVYPIPASHNEPDWLESHGGVARADITNCSTCHARTSCESCHVQPVPAAVEQLPGGGSDEAMSQADQQRGQGVALERRRPLSHALNFLKDHRALAAGVTAQCQVCHTTNQCVSCHAGSEALNSPGRDVALYHPENFMPQHSADAFGRANECSTCHNPQAFCRDCHSGQGLATRGRFDTGFHNSDERFVFGHGKAARQALESCTTCHSQQDCLVCHSAKGGRRVNPHGPGFDPEKLRSKNPELCLFCHFRGILDR